jgi:hypothetical protein
MDGEALVIATLPKVPAPVPSPVATTIVPLNYESVPWYRRDSTAGAALWLGFFCCAPALWGLGILCLTGDIYYASRRSGTDLPKWTKGSKIRVWILIAIQGLVLGWLSLHQRKVLPR